MHDDIRTITAGWSVYDANDDKIGDVASTGANYLLVQKGLLFVKDIYIPTDTIAELDTENQRAYLDVPKADIDSMGWDQPPTASDEALSGSSSRSGLGDNGMTRGAATTDDAARVTLHEEELQAQTRRQQAGEVQVSKRVVEDERELQVPVTREEVEVRRVRVDRDASADDTAFTQDWDTIRVPVTAEDVEVTKRPRVVEEIEISKRPVTETRTVRDTVRREEADIRQDGDVLTSDADRSGDLVGAGADRTERMSIDDIAGTGTGSRNRREGAFDPDRDLDSDDDARTIGGV